MADDGGTGGEIVHGDSVGGDEGGATEGEYLPKKGPHPPHRHYLHHLNED